MQDDPLVASAPPFQPLLGLFRKALAEGRLSSNLEDVTEGGGWNAKAKKAIADRYGSLMPPRAPDENNFYAAPPVPGTQPGVAGKTPDNLGIEDLFTRSQQHPDDFDNDTFGVQNVLAKAEAKSTQTPGIKPNQMDMATGAWQGDGSTNAPPVNGMTTQMVPQTMTPNPNPEPEAWSHMDAPMRTIPLYPSNDDADLPARASPADPAASPDLAGLLKSLFAF